MTTSLVQRAMFKQRTFELQAACIRVTDRDAMSGRSYDVPYEVMFGRTIEHRVSAAGSLILAVASGLSAILFGILIGVAPRTDPNDFLLWVCACPIASVVSVTFAIHWLRSRRELVQYVDSESSLYIRRDRPSVEAVDAFIEEARRMARERIRSRVLPLGRTDSERKDRAYAILLRDKGIISADECADFVKPPHSPYRDRLG